MAVKNITVFGIYAHRSNCEHAFSAFKTGGFRDEDISVLFLKNRETNDHITEKANNNLEVPTDTTVAGAVMGGTLAWLAATPTVPVRGLEQFFIAGPIFVTLAAIAVGGALVGLTGALLGLGVPEYKAKKYQVRIENGDILMFAHCVTSNLMDRAKRLFISTGAEDISSTDESSSGHHQPGA